MGKKMSETKGFKESIKRTETMMKDPNKAAETEAKLEHMLKVGNDQLKKGAMSAMEEAMAAMANPEVLSEMSKMMKDPKFLAQITAMTKDPQFKSYVDAVQDMAADPEKKKKLQKMSEAFRSTM